MKSSRLFRFTATPKVKTYAVEWRTYDGRVITNHAETERSPAWVREHFGRHPAVYRVLSVSEDRDLVSTK